MVSVKLGMKLQKYERKSKKLHSLFLTDRLFALLQRPQSSGFQVLWGPVLTKMVPEVEHQDDCLAQANKGKVQKHLAQ